MRDPYDILGVARAASEDDIKKAFRRLAKQHHPDHNKDNPKATQAFAEVNQAYEILGDKSKRAQFDRGEIDAEGKPRAAGFGGFGGGRRGAGGFDGFDIHMGPGGGRAGFGGGGFDDILEQMLGGARRRGGADPFAGAGAGPRGAHGHARGDDIHHDAPTPLETFLAGGKVRIELPTGKTLDVSIDPMTPPGEKKRLRGQGGAEPGQAPGDAWVTFVPAAHPTLRADGSDLRLDLPVTLEDAVLGAKSRVATLDGSGDVTIPAGTTGGKPLRLRGKGLPNKSGGRGDLLIYPRITLPEAGDPELEALLRKRRAAGR